MNELKWTKEAPTRTGWYWLTADPKVHGQLPEGVAGPFMVGVYQRQDAWWFEDYVNQENYPCVGEGRLWAGPLMPPDLEGE